MKPGEYEIQTIQNIIDLIDEDNIEAFLADFEIFLRQYILLKSTPSARANPKEIRFVKLTWIDDGYRGGTMNLEGTEFDNIKSEPDETT